MSTPQHDGNKPKSKRRLTVTYFVEPLDLRHLSIPVRRANAVLITAALSVVWTLGSVVYFGVDLVRRLKLHAMPLSANVEPFAANELQAALPLPSPAVADSIVELPSVAVAAPSATPVVVETVAPLSLPVDEVGHAVIGETTTADVVEPATPAAPVVPAAPAAPVVELAKIVLKNGAAKFDHKDVIAHVDVVNRGTRLASGRVWGVARYILPDGSSKFVPSHDGVDAEHPELASVGLGYKAARVSSKDLRFKAPRGDTSGRFTEIQLFASESRAKAPVTAKIMIADAVTP